MVSLRAYAACVLGSLVFLAPINATEASAFAMPVMDAPDQGGDGTITVNGLLHQGEEATVSYSNPNMANQTVIVDVDDGTPGGATDQVTIELDANGVGSKAWAVPAWDGANFNAPDAQELTKGIF